MPFSLNLFTTGLLSWGLIVVYLGTEFTYLVLSELTLTSESCSVCREASGHHFSPQFFISTAFLSSWELWWRRFRPFAVAPRASEPLPLPTPQFNLSRLLRCDGSGCFISKLQIPFHSFFFSFYFLYSAFSPFVEPFNLGAVLLSYQTPFFFFISSLRLCFLPGVGCASPCLRKGFSNGSYRICAGPLATGSSQHQHPPSFSPSSAPNLV